MKKFINKFIIISFVLLILNLNILPFVSAEEILTNVFDPVKEMFTNWEDGALSDNIAKYFLLILLTLVIFSILKIIPLIGEQNNALVGIIAFIVSFLATAYLSTSEIHAIIISYGALGFVLGAILPIIILLFFSIEIDKKGGTSGKILSKVIWIAFGIFLIWKLIGGYVDEQLKDWEFWGYIIIILFSLAWVFFLERTLLKILFKEEIKAGAEQLDKSSRRTALAEIAKAQGRAQALRENGLNAEAIELEKTIKSMEDALNK